MILGTLQMLETIFELYPVPIEVAVDVKEEDTVEVVEVRVEENETAEVLLGVIAKHPTPVVE